MTTPQIDMQARSNLLLQFRKVVDVTSRRSMLLMCAMIVTVLSRNAIQLNHEAALTFYEISLGPTEILKMNAGMKSPTLWLSL